VASKKPKRKPTGAKARAARKNGRRGGRPAESRKRTAAVSWVTIRRYARLGADKATIITALAIDKAEFNDAEFANGFEEELRRGEALHKIDLLEDHKRIRRGGDGSVNAIHKGLQQIAGWGGRDSGKGNKRPDDDAAIAEASSVLERLRS
jgi:hypothetical protein